MTFNLQVYYLVQRAIKEQKPHYKYSLVPKKLLLFLKESMGIQPVFSPGEKLSSPKGWIVLTQLRWPKLNGIISEHNTAMGKKHSRYCRLPLGTQVHGGEEPQAQDKCPSSLLQTLGTFQLFRLQGVEDCKYNTPWFPGSATPFPCPSLVPTTFIRDTKRLSVWVCCILFLPPHHRNPLIYPKAFQTSALNVPKSPKLDKPNHSKSLCDTDISSCRNVGNMKVYPR